MPPVQTGIFEWDSAYAVGVAEIDEDHKTLFKLVNELHLAMEKGEGQSTLHTLMEDLNRYVEYHFGYEERLMVAVDYPDIDRHTEEHEQLRSQVAGFAARYKAEMTVTIKLLLFLSEWLKAHTITTDRRLGEYVNARKPEA